MSFEPRELPIQIDEHASIGRCRFCDRAIWWGLTHNGKRNPFDVYFGAGEGEERQVRRTAITHWSTCRKRDEALTAFATGKKGL